MLLASQVERILAYGGGVTIDLKKQLFLAAQLERFAATAAQSGAALIIKNPQPMLLAASMERIAAFGRGRVMFEI